LIFLEICADDVQIIGNRAETPNSVRVLPPSMAFRAAANGVDLPSVPTLDDRRGAGFDESVIYQEALQVSKLAFTFPKKCLGTKNLWRAINV
jgi:hypothetical protein